MKHMEEKMNEKIVKFRSKSERESEIDLIAKYSAIGIAAIAAANTAFRGTTKKTEATRTHMVGYAD